MTVSWVDQALHLLENVTPCALVTVCAIEGSAPRETGARMLVSTDEQWGTIGGGALEYTAVHRARALLAQPKHTSTMDAFPLGPELGQCCGGRVLISYEHLGEVDRVWLRQAKDAIDNNTTITFLRTAGSSERRKIDGTDTNVPPPITLLDSENNSIAGIPESEKVAFLQETLRDARIPVYLFGAGHIGNEIARLAGNLPLTLHWVDRRADAFLNAPTHDNASHHQTSDELTVVQTAPPNSCYLVMTHDHQLDFEIVKAILARGDSAYCGLVGSLTKRARFENRLRRAGIEDPQLKQLRCPIGADGPQSKLPSIIALAAVHEMLLCPPDNKGVQ